jgi:valyl-tRNA synthetase
MRLDQSYNPIEIEAIWYPFWQENQLFQANENSDKPPFTIVIPPPNVTGSLHMGHALFVTLQDLMIRWKRMEGYETLWLPGTDHAGIATQVVVERMLREEGTNRHELGRAKFLERVWQWKETSGGRITEQLKRMGASCDWERERFTMDEGLSLAVREIFVRMFEDGLIYRGDRMVDWDPVTQTVLSKLEVLTTKEGEKGKFWYLRYPLADGTGEIIVGTTRPETMLGDTAVAVHPDDPRYTNLIGKEILLPLVGRRIPIIADTVLPDPEKGTGAVKVTPSHDPNDYECGLRHNLAQIQVIGLDARMTEKCPSEFIGLDRYEARKKVVERFEALGLLEKTEETIYNPGRSERSGVIVEPLVMKQWFVKTGPLAEKAIEAVETGATRITPPVWKKTYDHFMYNIHDWCISRQLWWGHQIPAWHCSDCKEITVSRQDAQKCAHCGSTALTQDPDVLDTWFSSGLWPFSTLGWPEKTASLQKFYPTQVMETGSDILFFWVARMMMMGIYAMGEVPFTDVYLHAMVRDEKGNKMSKVKGNVIDPLHMVYGAKPEDLDPKFHRELLKKCPDGVAPQGADALRLTLAILAAQARDVKLDTQRMEGYRAFLNKLWNAARFALMNLDGFTPAPYPSYTAGWDDSNPPFEPEYQSLADQWVLCKLNTLIQSIQTALEEFRFNDAAQELYHFIWHTFCDWYVEFIKPDLYNDNAEHAKHRAATQATLSFTLDTLVRLIHPFCPFITEDIWQSLPKGSDAPVSVMVATWPKPDARLNHPDAVKTMEVAIELINAIRQIRGETGVKAGVIIDEVFMISDQVDDSVKAVTDYVKRQARIASIRWMDHAGDSDEGSATAVVGSIEIRIPLKGLINVEEELVRLNKEIKKTEEDIEFVSKKLNNERFVSRAPDHIVAKEREKLAAFLHAKETLQKSLEELQLL